MKFRFFWVFLLIVFALPVLPGAVAVPEYWIWITLLNYIGLYSIIAIGLVLLTGMGGMTSFGQAAFVGVGAYATAFLTMQYSVSPWLALVAGVVLTALIALLLGLITMRLSDHFLPLGTIAWGLSLFYLFGNMELLGKYDGINGIPVLNLFGWHLESGRSIYYLIWVVVLLAVVSVRNLLNSRPGCAIRALRRHDGRSDGRQHGMDAHRHLYLCGRARGDFRLPVRAFAARGESDTVRAEPRHRVLVYGRDGGRISRLRCDSRRDHPYRSSGLSADAVAEIDRRKW